MSGELSEILKAFKSLFLILIIALVAFLCFFTLKYSWYDKNMFEVSIIKESITFEGLNGEKLQTGIYLYTIICQTTGSTAEIKEGEVLTFRDDPRGIKHKNVENCTDREIVIAVRQAIGEE